MAKLAELYTELTVRDRKFKAGMKGARKSITQTAAELKSFAATAAKALLVATAAVGGLLVLLARQEKAEAKLNAVLKSTGQAAGLTAKELLKMAASFQEMSTFGDEAVINMQALLLTFKEIKGPIFKAATQAVLDMATVMDQDLRSTAIQVGKALNDPILGVTALRRVGVQLTEEQVDLIESFVKVNNIAAAQKVILGELASQFGGTAKAQAETFTGSIKQLGNSLGDIGEEVAKVFIPLLQEVGTFLKDVLPDVKAWIKENKELLGQMVKLAGAQIIAALKIMAKTVEVLADAFDKWAPAVERVVNGLVKGAEAMGIFATEGKKVSKLTGDAELNRLSAAKDRELAAGGRKRGISREGFRRVGDTSEVQRGRLPGEQFEPTTRKGEVEGRAASFTGIADLFKQVQLAALNRKRDQRDVERLKLQRENLKVLEQIREGLNREGGAVRITA